MKGRITRPNPTAHLEFPLIGKIKIGIKSEKGYPRSVDYFVPTGKYAPLFTQAYGEKPQTIQIVFPADDAEQVCNELYEYRDNAGARVAYGDGDTFFVWNGKQYAEFKAEQYPDLMQRIQAKHPNKTGWQVTLTLTFLIPCVRGVLGCWQFITKGNLSTIPNIRNTFDLVCEQKGGVKNIVFDLNVQFAKSQKPDNSSRFPVVALVPNESRENLIKIKEAFKPIKLIEQ